MTRSNQQIAKQWLKQCLLLLRSHSLLDTCHLLSHLSHPLSCTLTQRLHHAVNQGFTLSDMLDKLPELFPTMIRSRIRIGEQCGQLSQLGLAALAAHQRHTQLNRRLQQQLIYPALLFISCLAVLVSVLVWLIPSMQDLYQDLNHPLPSIITHWLTLKQHSLQILFGVATVGVSVFAYARTRWRHWLQGLPHYQQHVLAQWLGDLSALLTTSVPLAVSIQYSNTNLPTAWQTHSNTVLQTLQAGKPFATAITTFPGITSLIQETLALGELNQQLAKTLQTVADTLQERLTQQRKRLITLIQPLCMLLIAGMIGGLFYVMYQPMLQMTLR